MGLTRAKQNGRMISPVPGIHRPSYNGAPAILTRKNY